MSIRFGAIITSSTFLKSIFVLALFILIFISGISYKHTVTLTHSTQWVVHSYKVHMELGQMESSIKDAETGQRGFIISRDSIFLQPYYAGQDKVNVSFNRLKILTKDNLQQQNNLDTLYGLIHLRFSLLANLLVQSTLVPNDKALMNRTMLTGKSVMDAIHAQINKMTDLEMVYLKERERKYEHEISFTPLFSFLMLSFSLVVLIFSYLNIIKNYNSLKRSNRRLVITTESFQHAEEIGNFSSWQWDLDANILTYSENYYNLLGVKPHSFKPTLENFLEFVHPEDRGAVREGITQVVNGKQPSSSFFRIIRKDGALRYFKSVGKVLTETSGKKMLIGINRDVTVQYLRSLALEERNHELEQSNKELASFNHIASHDLQEPLRKIQTFISRIAEKETEAISETAKEYFSKIQMAANRMRILIDDLLLFSRATKTDKVFEKTNLNLLLEAATQELAQTIEEKDAIVQSVELPVLNVIPFQIQQLFVNLIGNSLKYNKSGIAPLIEIACKKVKANKTPLLKSESNHEYYHISITDNGIGFEQEHAENIFVLFHRLHHLAEYPGTGIGLAICKKIVENHKGFIVAESKRGMGSTFNIFLPK